MSTLKLASVAVLALVCLTADPAAVARPKSRLPHWTGQWQIEGVTPSASGGLEQSLDEILQSMRQWGPPPYGPQAQAVFDRIAARVRSRSEQALGTGILPREVMRPACTFGFPAVVLFSPLMFEILITRDETAMIFSDREIRHIYTDGRAHVPADESFPTPWGDSIGHWEGRTLVIDTVAVGFMGLPGILAMGGDSNAQLELVALFSPEVRFIERIRMLDEDHLEDQVTIIDPRAFTAPWQVSRKFSRVTTVDRMIHEDCEGEERNPIVNGRYTLVPPPPPRVMLPPPFGPGPIAPPQ